MKQLIELIKLFVLCICFIAVTIGIVCIGFMVDTINWIIRISERRDT